MLGIDVVDIERLRLALARTPTLERRLFSTEERNYCRAHPDSVARLAGTLAAKEAVIKALRLGSLAAWAARVEIDRASSGAPSARVDDQTVAVSIAHDGGVAVAVAVAFPNGAPLT